MTSTSQNGWTLAERDQIATFTVPGTTVRLPIRLGDVATVLLYVAERFHNEVEPLHAGWCWGFAARTIRGSTTVASNHASATAIDLNAPAHPLATSPASNYSAKEIAAIHKIIAFCDGVVRWGGDYSGRKDGMHFEINKSASAVAALALKIRKAREAATPTKSISHVLVEKTPHHRQTMLLQSVLDALPGISVDDDGEFGPKTTTALKKAQKAKGIKADGAAGPATCKALNIKWTGK